MTPSICISAATVRMYIFTCLVLETIASDWVCLLCELQEFFHCDLWGYSLRGRWQVQAFERCSACDMPQSADVCIATFIGHSISWLCKFTCFKTVLCYVAVLGTVEHSKHGLYICLCKKRTLPEKQRWDPFKITFIYYAIRTILLDFFILFNSFKRKALGSSGRL